MLLVRSGRVRVRSRHARIHARLSHKSATTALCCRILQRPADVSASPTSIRRTVEAVGVTSTSSLAISPTASTYATASCERSSALGPCGVPTPQCPVAWKAAVVEADQAARYRVTPVILGWRRPTQRIPVRPCRQRVPASARRQPEEPTGLGRTSPPRGNDYDTAQDFRYFMLNGMRVDRS